jgi:flavin reductase (DIM6/NTAB) family NADH-FMN oxidoreductase RutF
VHFDLSTLDPTTAYKLLAATIVPRPIAWVVSQSAEGHVNCAPFSFFNCMGPNPPIIVLGIERRNGVLKDTAQNIIETGAFVINMVPFALAEQMSLTAIDAPSATNELEFAGLETTASTHIKPPRIAKSPVAFECVKQSIVETGPNQLIVIGRVLAIHIADQYVKDAARGHVDTDALDLIGRTFGSDYIKTRDTFKMTRPTWATFKDKR